MISLTEFAFATYLFDNDKENQLKQPVLRPVSREDFEQAYADTKPPSNLIY